MFTQEKSVQKITFLKNCDFGGFPHSFHGEKGILLILGLLVLLAVIVGCVFMK